MDLEVARSSRVEYPMVEETGTLFTSYGNLHYEGLKLIVVVDPEIVRYYRHFIPKWQVPCSQLYLPHISVVRKEFPPCIGYWGKHEGEEVEFQYSNIIYNGKVYWWLNVYSFRLEEIRLELGLSIASEYTRPPDAYKKVFHITLGNNKCHDGSR